MAGTLSWVCVQAYQCIPLFEHIQLPCIYLLYVQYAKSVTALNHPTQIIVLAHIYASVNVIPPLGILTKIISPSWGF